MTTLLLSVTQPASEGTMAHRIILRTDGRKFVTHMQTLPDGGFHWGHYFDTQVAAEMDFLSRMKKAGLCLAHTEQPKG